MKKILLALLGIIYGVIGEWFLLLSLIFIQHPDSSPGTKDWEEDKIFIPVGYIIIFIGIVFDIVIYIKLKNSKEKLFVFFGAMIISAVGAFLFQILNHNYSL